MHLASSPDNTLVMAFVEVDKQDIGIAIGDDACYRKRYLD